MAEGRWQQGDDPETREAEQDMHERLGFEVISKIWPVSIYILTLSV